MNFRTPESIKRKLDAMLKKGKVHIEHNGIGCYDFVSYEYLEPCFINKWQSSIVIYGNDGRRNHYLGEFTEKNLQPPTKEERECRIYFFDRAFVSWDKQFPTILEIRD